VHRSTVAEAGIVDQDLDIEPESRDRGLHGVAARLLAEVGGDHLGADAVGLRQLRGEFAQPLLATGDEDDAVTALGKLAGNRGADARRGSGDERGG
jgi:hypothetical protein